MRALEYDLVAVGGGTAGLVTAAGASYLGLKAGLLEREALGGDCLWTGCVPSKALVASARLAHAMRHAEHLGLKGASPSHALGEVMARMRDARERVAHHDDPARFRKMGVGVHFGAARFVAPGTLEVEGVGRIRAKRVVLATGAVPAVPSLPGLTAAGFLTYATVFDRDSLPATLVVLGGGPVGLELAQVFQRLGSRVTVVEMLPEILPREEADVAAAVRKILETEGVRFVLGRRPTEVRRGEDGKAILLEGGRRVDAEEILLATGRVPSTEGLNLEGAGVELEGSAVRVDRALRTSASGVWAAGDVTGGPQFTHVADYTARLALQNAIFPWKRKVDYRSAPRVTYTDPEVGHVGMGMEEAEAEGARVYSYPFRELDRSIVEGETEGFVRVAADRRGRILGATVLGRDAGELLLPLVLAMQNRIPLSRISGVIFPYPTRMEAVKRTADAYQRGRLEGIGGRMLRRVVSWLA